MTPSKLPLVLFAAFCVLCTSLAAQDKAARNRMMAAHGQYYTPTVSGLKSFHCEATMDWKALLTRFSGNEIAEDNPFVKYLKTVHLSVEDDLKGKGSLEWSSTGVPPEGKEASIKQMQEGFQQMMAGFFQSWNAYMNGSMVPIPDSTVTITTASEGVHLSGTANGGSLDEDFDKNLLLTQVLVVNPEIRVLAKPIYSATPDGLLVSAVTSQINQPPSAPQTEAVFRIEYAKVDAFQIPSRVVVDLKNTGIIELGFNACQVSVADWAKKP